MDFIIYQNVSKVWSLIFLEILTKYDCHLQVFPLNKRISLN